MAPPPRPAADSASELERGSIDLEWFDSDRFVSGGDVGRGVDSGREASGAEGRAADSGSGVSCAEGSLTELLSVRVSGESALRGTSG